MNKITFFGVSSKIAEKRIFLIFVDSDLNICKASQVRAFLYLCTDNYENSDTSQQKSRKCVFRPFLNRHQKKLFYSLFPIRPKYYESSKTEYSDSTSFINRLTPLLFWGGLTFFRGAKRGVPPKNFKFFCSSPSLIYWYTRLKLQTIKVVIYCYLPTVIWWKSWAQAFLPLPE